MKIDPVVDKGVERTLYETGTYEIGTLNILRALFEKNQVFYDIGANIGLITLFVANLNRRTGKVFSFEPEPNTFQILKDNIELNGFTNICTFQMALGAGEATGKIFSNLEVNRGAASLVINKSNNGSPVHIKSLDNFINENNLPIPDIVKIDVEGFELEVLKGSRRILSNSNAPILCLEYSHDTDVGNTMIEIYNFLRNVNDYKIFKFERWKGYIGQLIEVNSLEEMPRNDNVFCFLYGHLKKVKKEIFLKTGIKNNS